MFISPLDDNYITLKRASILIARERPGSEPDGIMEVFKRAIFAQEFEHEEVSVLGQEKSEILNFLLLHIEAPPTQQAVSGLPPEQQPQEIFAVKCQTVAEILSERDALPGEAQNWPMLFESPHNSAAMDNALHDLARIPYAMYPSKARDILGGIFLSRAKLSVWMRSKNYALPRFLADLPPASDDVIAPATEMDASEQPDHGERGRPRKPGWQRAIQLVRELHVTHPDMKHGALAFEAHRRAALEFDVKDLPSMGTILRHMKSILAQ